jgi:predicted SnoaL-like aldol condensation-catalyzing enzyme
MTEPMNIATSFLQEVISGRIDEAFDKYVDPSGKHHNIATPAGMEALKHGMNDAGHQFPDKTYSLVLTLEDGPLVAVYGHLRLSPKIDLATVHIFRIEHGKITEFWDCSQSLPDKPVNTDGAF